MLNEGVVLFCNDLSKDNIEEKINFLITTANCTYTEEEINTMLINVIDKLVETKKYEFIERVIGDNEKLKELMDFFPSKKEYLYHLHIGSLSINGKFQEVLNTFENIYLKKMVNFKEKIKYNVARAYAKLEIFDKSIEILEKTNNLESKIFLGYTYSLINDNRDKDIYDEILKRNKFLNPRDKTRIFIGYCKYYLRNNNIPKVKSFIEKILEEMPELESGKRNLLLYELAQLFKILENRKEYTYYLKQSAIFNAGDELEMTHKIKAIEELYAKKLIKKEKVLEMLSINGYLAESDIVRNKIRALKGEVI